MIFKKFLEFSLEFSLVTAFITIFFFTIGLEIEHYSINKQLDNLSNQLYDTITSNIFPLLLFDKTTFFKDIAQSNLENISEESNNSLIIKLSVIMAVIGLTIVGIWLKFRKTYKINIGYILLENIILFIFVGSFEYYFFTHFVTKYVPLLPSEVSSILLKKMQNKIHTEKGDITDLMDWWEIYNKTKLS